MSGAAVAWMLLTLLLSANAAQGPQDDEPLGKEPPGSPSMVIRLAHRLNRRGMPIATKRDLSRYYFSATNDMGVTHCMLQGVLRNASDDPKEPSAPPPYWDHENDPHMCKHLRDLAHAGENAYLHLMMRMIVDNGTAYIRGVTLVEPVGKHPVAWHFLTQSWRSETWSHKLYLGSMRTGNIYGPLTVAPAGWMQWEGKWYGGELWTRIFFEPFELLPEDAVNPELEVYSDMFGYTCFLKPSTDSPLERLVSKALNPTKLNPTARPVAKPRTVFFMTGFFLLNPEWGATMMTWHINWHKQFGVDLTVMYVFMDMIALVENPKVQALVERGKLAIVHWDVSPGLATPMFTNDTRFMCTEKTGYWNQIYIYNHFMVSMWLEDVRVIIGDVDEWLITPKPTTIWQMFDECVPEHEKADPKPVALLTLMRRAAYCKDCQNRSEVFEFMERDPNGAASQHPLNKYVLGTDDDPMKPKSIYNPALIMSVDPHLGWALEGSIRRKYDKACAYLLHVRKLFVNRPLDEGLGTPLSREELWPLYQPHVP